MNEIDQVFLDKKTKALAMGGAEKLAKRKAQGRLNARERIDYLLDGGSFVESGLLSTSAVASEKDRSPCDGKITGFGKINGRRVSLVSNDFTVFGASSAAVNGKKIGHIKKTATQRGMPLIFLGESSGARMPDHMGSAGMGSLLGNDGTQYRRTREIPWVSATLGMSYGSSSWYSVMSDFNVMRKGAILAVSSPMLASMAIGEEVDPEALGGWRLHSEVTGFADVVVNSDEEALDAIRNFLSYLPSHHKEAPPRAPVPAGSGEGMQSISALIPESRTQVYDIRKVIKTVVDKDSFFELKARFGKTAVTGLARMEGRSVGFVANNPLNKGGALDTDACDKICKFLVLCDSFNIPLIFLVDTPGFMIGTEAERRRAPGKIMNYMNALSLVTVPKISILLRKSYGQAYLNMGGGKNSDEFAAWPTAEVSFMDPQFAVKIVHGLSPEDEGFEAALAGMNKGNSVWDIASIYAVQTVIDPSETRSFLLEMLDIHEMRITGGVGEHLMKAWPTSY